MSAETKTVIDAWNAMAERTGLSRIRLMNKARSTHLAARLEESSPSHVVEAVGKLEASDFCRGRNNRGWKADFDFFLQPASVTRLLEGRYDNRQPQRGGNGPGGAFRNPAIEIMAREANQPAAMVIDGVPYAPPMIEGPAGG